MSTHPPDISSAAEHVLGADGEFHVTDRPIDLSGHGWEDWLALAAFWTLAAVVFIQVFTRYALNDSAGWTEEIARYLLVGVVFIGASMSVRKNNHIQVDVFYRFMPARADAPFDGGRRHPHRVPRLRRLAHLVFS